jgi:hypothetical protein
MTAVKAGNPGETNQRGSYSWDMTMDRRKVRNLLPNGRYGYGDRWTFGVKDKRRRAIENALTKLPDRYFASFRDGQENWAWFVPWIGIWGKAAEIPHKPVILYLSPALEFAAEWVVESVAVHEILHVVLGHKLADCTKEENDRQEDEIKIIMTDLGYSDPSDELTKLFESFPQ